jgi:hypothetical protein
MLAMRIVALENNSVPSLAPNVRDVAGVITIGDAVPAEVIYYIIDKLAIRSCPSHRS